MSRKPKNTSRSRLETPPFIFSSEVAAALSVPESKVDADRAEAARTRLAEEIISALNTHTLWPPKKGDVRNVTFSQVRETMKESHEMTFNKGRDPETRQRRAAGRLCSMLIELDANIRGAEQEGRISKKQASKLGALAYKRAQKALSAIPEAQGLLATKMLDEETGKIKKISKSKQIKLQKRAKRKVGRERSKVKSVKRKLSQFQSQKA